MLDTTLSALPAKTTRTKEFFSNTFCLVPSQKGIPLSTALLPKAAFLVEAGINLKELQMYFFPHFHYKRTLKKCSLIFRKNRTSRHTQPAKNVFMLPHAVTKLFFFFSKFQQVRNTSNLRSLTVIPI